MSPRRGRRRATVLAIALVAAGASALSVVPAGAGGDDDAWAPLLARVPDTARYRELVLVSDYEAAEEDVDVESGGDARERLASLTLEGGMSPSELVQTLGRDEDALRDELGIPVTGIDRELTAGNPPDAILVLDGDVDGDRIESATADDDVWSDLRDERSHAGQDYYAWDGEKLHPDRITPVRRIGRGGRLAVDPPLAVWTNTDRAMEASLEASGGDERSLADDRELMAVVEAVRDEDAFTMVLTDEAPAPGADTGGPEPLLTPTIIALGATADDGDAGMVVVLRQDSAADAEENATRLRAIAEEGTSDGTRQPWNELLTVDEIETDGDLVIATFDVESPGLWLKVVLTRDSLLATAP